MMIKKRTLFLNYASNPNLKNLFSFPLSENASRQKMPKMHMVRRKESRKEGRRVRRKKKIKKISLMVADPAEKGLQGRILLKPMSGLPIFRSEVVHNLLVCDRGNLLSNGLVSITE